jgi:uncharacterized protein (TIGR02145 family)
MKIMSILALIIFNGAMASAQTITDTVGNIYKTVQIGKQIWLAENLKTTKLNDGSPIPFVSDIKDWSNLSTPGYCYYENDQVKFGGIFGVLYNWFAVNTGKLCPDGWHVPTDSDWKMLTSFLGGKITAGNKLKEEGNTHWIWPNSGATNETGWTALPGGRRNSGGVFSSVGEWSYFWSSTPVAENKAWYYGIGNSDGTIDRYTYRKKSGFSVRCLHD